MAKIEIFKAKNKSSEKQNKHKLGQEHWGGEQAEHDASESGKYLRWQDRTEGEEDRT